MDDSGLGAADDGGMVQVPATTLAYWRGRFDTMAEWAHALDGLIQHQREQFARFTQGVTDFRESGVLPAAPPGRPTIATPAAISQATRELDALANGGAPAERAAG
jgi:hypothetical protein